MEPPSRMYVAEVAGCLFVCSVTLDRIARIQTVVVTGNLWELSWIQHMLAQTSEVSDSCHWIYTTGLHWKAAWRTRNSQSGHCSL